MKIKIAENIKSMRRAHSLTQEQMAEALGVTVGAVYKWEAGLSIPEIKLIMEMADFFEISVDALLGYEQQKGNIENRIERIRQCILQRDFEEGVLETEKALKKYPNHFEMVYVGGMLYMLKFAEEKYEDDMMRSNQLFEKAISLLYQNTEKRENEATILNYMAQNYLAAGDIKQGLKILEENNICNMNSGWIGFIYATELEKGEEAEPYLCSSMAEVINQVIYVTIGKAFAYAQNKNEKCITTARWLIDFFDSIREEDAGIIFADKITAALLAQCAVWKISFGDLEEARKYMTEAYTLAVKFDETKVYTTKGVKFLETFENEGVAFDGIGRTAMEAIENYVFGKITDVTVEKQVKEEWERVKNGDKTV